MKNLLSSKNLFAGHQSIWYVLLALLITMTSTNLSAQESEDFQVCVDGLNYHVSYTMAEIISYEPDAIYGELNIPSSIFIQTDNGNIEEVPVTRIAEKAFAGCEGLSKLVFPSSNQIYEIADSAFAGCLNLESVDIHLGSQGYVGSNAFKGCTALVNVNLSNVYVIGDNAFEGCTSLKNMVGAIHNIFMDTFKDCTSLETLNCEVNFIGQYAFRDCNSLKYVELTGINDDTASYHGAIINGFEGCKSLKTVVLSGVFYSIGGFQYTPLESITWPGDNCVESITMEAFMGCHNLPEDIVLPKGIKSIGNRAFSGMINVSSMQIPESVTEIGEQAFYCCKKLGSIKIPESVTSLGSGAFYGCEALSSVSLPSNMKKIPDYLFERCGSLNTIELNDGIETIGSGAFRLCSSLKSIKLPKNLKSIGSQCFYGSALCDTLTIPENVTTVWFQAFNECPDITTVVSNATTPPVITIISDYGYDLQLFSDECYAKATLIVPDGSVDLYKQADEWKKFYKIISEKEATGITSVSENTESASPKYNLNGMRIKQARTGEVYIKDGKKFIAK